MCRAPLARVCTAPRLSSSARFSPALTPPPPSPSPFCPQPSPPASRQPFLPLLLLDNHRSLLQPSTSAHPRCSHPFPFKRLFDHQLSITRPSPTPLAKQCPRCHLPHLLTCTSTNSPPSLPHTTTVACTNCQQPGHLAHPAVSSHPSLPTSPPWHSLHSCLHAILSHLDYAILMPQHSAATWPAQQAKWQGGTPQQPPHTRHTHV